MGSVGDRTAFAGLHERYASMVHGIVLARVPLDEADDLVQEVFLIAMRKLPTLRDPAAIGPWLARITRNVTVRFHRTRARTRRLHRDLAANPDPGRAGEGSPTAEARAALAVIGSLPEAYRETLILRLVEGLSGPQIADRTGHTPGSVRVNLCRGMALLKQRLRTNARKEQRIHEW